MQMRNAVLSEESRPVGGSAHPPLAFAMASSAATTDVVARGFELACFIHRHRQTAMRVVANALMKLDVATARQDKRLYYNPAGRSGAQRTKVVLGRAQLFQRLLLIESEPFELAKEGSGQATRDDLLIHFIKDLVRITIKRNSFYVALGMSRVLHNYSTAETMGIYDALVTDPAHVRDDSYYRSRKGRLMSELEERFGSRLTLVRGARGEERFRSRSATARERELVQEALTLLTPWDTACSSVPAPTSTAGRHGNGADDRMDEELSRFHAILHPTCYERLSSSLGLPRPHTRLEVPQFDCEQDDDRSTPQRITLLDHERNQIEAMVAAASRARRGLSVFRLRVVVDGRDRLTFDANEGGEIRIDDSAELIEVVSGSGAQAVLLATRLIGENDHSLEQITLEDGQRIAIRVTPLAGGGATVGIEYRPKVWEHLRQRIGQWARRAIPVAAPITAALLLAVLMRPDGPVAPPPPAPLQPVTDVTAPAPAKVVPQAAPKPISEPEPITAPESITRGLAAEAGVQLRGVRTVWISTEDTGLASTLSSTLGNRWTISASPDEADAALKIVATDSGSVRVRLVNAAGTVLWPAQQEGREYRGTPDEIAQQIAADLVAAAPR